MVVDMQVKCLSTQNSLVSQNVFSAIVNQRTLGGITDIVKLQTEILKMFIKILTQTIS